MNEQYRTVAKAAQAETIIKKSKFICYVSPVQSVEEALAFVDNISKKHWDATHNVPAWRVGQPIPAEKFSDDGEPSGTAGMPLLEVLRKQELTNCAVVVTRYFGGVLLGAGGLVRAYTRSVVDGLAESGIITYRRYRRFQVVVPYALLGLLMHLLQELEAKVESPEFGEQVTVNGLVQTESAEILERKISELGQGLLNIVWGNFEHVC